MKNRLLAKIEMSKASGRKLFCAFLTLGYPNLKTTEKLIEEFERAGVDIIELGYPFSDPLADGPTIQFSSQKALDKGVLMHDAFALVKRLRKKGVRVPIVFFSYLNPIYHYGTQRFPKVASKAGFDGLLVPDLPPEEEKELTKTCQKTGLPQIYLIAPTTSAARSIKIGRASKGFIYYVSLRGVTGARKSLPKEINKHLTQLKKKVSKPLLVGFGVSSLKQVKRIGRQCAGIIVGSAIIEKIRHSRGEIRPAVAYVSRMVSAVHAKKK